MPAGPVASASRRTRKQLPPQEGTQALEEASPGVRVEVELILVTEGRVMVGREEHRLDLGPKLAEAPRETLGMVTERIGVADGEPPGEPPGSRAKRR